MTGITRPGAPPVRMHVYMSTDGAYLLSPGRPLGFPVTHNTAHLPLRALPLSLFPRLLQNLLNPFLAWHPKPHHFSPSASNLLIRFRYFHLNYLENVIVSHEEKSIGGISPSPLLTPEEPRGN